MYNRNNILLAESGHSGTDSVRLSVGVPEECVTYCTIDTRGCPSEETGANDGGCHEDRTGLVRATRRYDWPPLTVSDGITPVLGTTVAAAPRYREPDRR